MEDYTYKCIPASQNINVGKKGNANSTAQSYQALINSGSVGGWEFDRIITTTTHIPVGCLASLMGAKAQTIDQNILVFKKRNSTDTPSYQPQSAQQPYNDANLLSEMNINKLEIIEQLKSIDQNLVSLKSAQQVVSSKSSVTSSTAPVKRMTMAEYQAKKAAEESAKKSS